jgi:hypothetical protein
MNTRVLVAAAGAAVAVAVAVAFVLTRRPAPPAEPEEATPAAVSARPESAPAAPTSEAPADALRARRGAAVTPAQPEAPAAAEVPAAVEAAPVVGTLRIESDVPGAQVFIDRQYVGATPVTAENVKPGTHQLNVSAEGFDGVARSIEVEPGSHDLMIRFREVRLDSRIPVVHKHRMGSCTGTLVATAQGLRYDTGDKDDQFTAAFADLEQFQVDYTEKNLKVKLRKGKQYNFTDPDGNADKLFVFHRDVDKARQRLAKGEPPAS